MRFYSILYFVAVLAITAIPKSDPVDQPTNSDLPARIQTLKHEIKGLEQSIQKDSGCIDKANSWYRGLGVATLVLGALLGGLSWLAQRRASDIELSSRPASKSLADKNRSLNDAENQFAQIQIAEERTATEKERNARLKLEGQLSPRRLTGAQIHQLANSLPPPYPKGIVIVSALNDGESSDFADDFERAFKLAKWQTTRFRADLTTDRGVQIGYVPLLGLFSPEQAEEQAKELRKLIKAIGIEAPTTPLRESYSSGFPGRDFTYLMIKLKPEIVVESHDGK